MSYRSKCTAPKLGEDIVQPYRMANCRIADKGLIDLARRAGTMVEAHEVHQNDKFEFSYGLKPDLVHVPALEDRGPVIAYYAVWRNEEQFGFEVMSKEDVENHRRKYAKAVSEGSPWNTNFDAMALKTVLKKALKYAPISTDFQHQLQTDERITNEILPDMTEAEDKTVIEIDADTGEVMRDAGTEV